MSTAVLIVLIILVALILLGALVVIAKNNAKPVPQKICVGCRRVMLPVRTKCLFCG